MSPLLNNFLRAKCVRHPAAVVPLADLMAELRRSIPADALETWRRERVISELRAAGFSIGVIDRVYHIGGLALNRQWQEQNGQLVAVSNV